MTTVNMPARIILPIDFDEAIHVELAGDLPLDVAKLLEQARADGYAAGSRDTLQHAAWTFAEVDALEPGWRAANAATFAQRRQEEREAREARIAARRAQDNINAGRHPDWQYTGQTRGGSGAVCWETGYPVETANAWLGRPRWMPIPTREARRIPAPITGPLATVTPIRQEQTLPMRREAA